MTKELQLKLI